jgi:hypothetical protein
MDSKLFYKYGGYKRLKSLKPKYENYNFKLRILGMRNLESLGFM